MTKELQGGNGRSPQTVPEPADKKPAVTAAMVKGCPHFALLNDPDTSLLFPSSMGYCHHAQPPAPVRLNHQEAFCLTARHTACPVFQQRGSGPLPAEILGRQEPVARPARLLPRVAGGVALLAIVALLVAWGSGLVGLTADEPAAATPLPLAAAVATATDAATAPATASAAAATATGAPAATETAVPSATPAPTDTPEPPPTVTPIPTEALPATFTPAPPPARAAISAVPVNVRTGPDISYPALLSVNELGARYDITGRLETGGWWRICCVNGRDGWIADEGVTVDGDLTAVPALPLPAPQVVVEVERLNVRGGPSVDYPVLALVAAGTVFEIGGRLNDGTWWEVCCLDDGGSGWVIAESVTVWGVTDGVPVVEVPPLPTEEE